MKTTTFSLILCASIGLAAAISPLSANAMGRSHPTFHSYTADCKLTALEETFHQGEHRLPKSIDLKIEKFVSTVDSAVSQNIILNGKPMLDPSLLAVTFEQGRESCVGMFWDVTYKPQDTLTFTHLDSARILALLGLEDINVLQGATVATSALTIGHIDRYSGSNTGCRVIRERQNLQFIKVSDASDGLAYTIQAKCSLTHD